MSSMQEREMQLVSGTVASLVSKANDNFQIVVRPDGSQYTKNLWTKDEPLVRDIQARGIGQAFDFMCNVSYWTNQSGQQIRSLWLETVAAHGTLAPPAPVQTTGGLPGVGGGLPVGAPLAPQQPVSGLPMGPGLPAPSPGPAPVQGQTIASDPDWQQIPPVVKDARIMRQTAMKCAVHMLPYLSKDMQNVSGLEFVAERFVAYFMAGAQDSDLQASYASRGQEQRQEHVGGGSDYDPNYAAHADEVIAARDDETPPDWVTNDGPVPMSYTAADIDPQTPTGYQGEFPA